MESRWLSLSAAAEYLSCSVTTVKRQINDGCLRWHQTPIGFKRLDREEIDRIFTPYNNKEDRKRGVVTEEDERRYVRRKPKKSSPPTQ